MKKLLIVLLLFSSFACQKESNKTATYTINVTNTGEKMYVQYINPNTKDFVSTGENIGNFSISFDVTSKDPVKLWVSGTNICTGNCTQTMSATFTKDGATIATETISEDNAYIELSY